jgi:hypothetical protein
VLDVSGELEVGFVGGVGVDDGSGAGVGVSVAVGADIVVGFVVVVVVVVVDDDDDDDEAPGTVSGGFGMAMEAPFAFGLGGESVMAQSGDVVVYVDRNKERLGSAPTNWRHMVLD